MDQCVRANPSGRRAPGLRDNLTVSAQCAQEAGELDPRALARNGMDVAFVTFN